MTINILATFENDPQKYSYQSAHNNDFQGVALENA